MAKNENPTPAASGAGAGETDIINKELSAALARVHHRLRPWHVYGVLGVCIVAAVLSAVLVHVRDQQRSDALIQSQVNVSLLIQLLNNASFSFESLDLYLVAFPSDVYFDLAHNTHKKRHHRNKKLTCD